MNLRLFKIKNYGKANLKSLQEGFSHFEPIRLIVANYFDLEYLFEKKKNMIKSAGLDRKLNPVDLIIVKTLSIITTIVFNLIYFKIEMVKVQYDFTTFLVNNAMLLILSFWLIILVIFIDNFIFKIIRKSRQSAVLERLIFFINLFKSNVLAGDNLYQSLLSCAAEIPGVLGTEIEKSCSEFATIGKRKALENLSQRLDVEELTDFIDVILAGLDIPEQNFANFLTENELKIQEIKESDAFEKQAVKPIQVTLANILSFISVFSLMLAPFIFWLIEYMKSI